MSTFSYSARENDLFELVYVKEEKESFSVDDAHLAHVIVKEEHDKHQLPSSNLSKLDANHLEPAIVRKGKHIRDETSVSSEHLLGTEDPDCEEIVEVSFGVLVYWYPKNLDQKLGKIFEVQNGLHSEEKEPLFILMEEGRNKKKRNWSKSVR